METENKDKWTPEVGKTAWLASAHNIMQLEIIEEGISAPPSFRCKGMGFNAFIFAYKLFPTAEAALASIKAYDLEGKEVVIPRARVDLPDHTHLLHHSHGICTECGKTIELDPETGESLGKIAKLAYTMEAPCDPVAQERLRKAQERFSQDRREGGC